MITKYPPILYRVNLCTATNPLLSHHHQYRLQASIKILGPANLTQKVGELSTKKIPPTLLYVFILSSENVVRMMIERNVEMIRFLFISPAAG